MTRSRSVRVIALLVVSSAIAGLAQEKAGTPQEKQITPTYRIDLLGRTVSNETVKTSELLELPFGRRDSPPAHRPAPPPVLSLQLLGLDRSLYTIGDQFVYEMVVKNIGQKLIPFPTSIEQSRFPQNTPKAVGAFVSLKMNDRMFGLQIIGTQPLYGAPGVPESVIVLGPGETVEIRATGQWYLQGAFAQRPPARWSRDVLVRASVQLFSRDEAYPGYDSSNTVEVQLQNH